MTETDSNGIPERIAPETKLGIEKIDPFLDGWWLKGNDDHPSEISGSFTCGCCQFGLESDRKVLVIKNGQWLVRPEKTIVPCPYCEGGIARLTSWGNIEDGGNRRIWGEEHGCVSKAGFFKRLGLG